MTQRSESIDPRPRLLDLFCGAGGASTGYHRAGFEVVGVDIAPQPNYPFEFHQADALDYLHELYERIDLCPFDVIHASPPCQAFTAYRRKGHGVGGGYPNLIDVVRNALWSIGLPYVIENVPGAPLESPVTLCGSSFGLDVRRHRLFESNVPMLVPACNHSWQTPRFAQATNRANKRSTVEIGVWRIDLEVQKRAMGVDWDVTREELSQMIPPRYSEFIGKRLLEHIATTERIAT
jgi:DNA (cytosine-5)-methyltransferase 1